MEGAPYRPEIVLWLELSDDLVVGSVLRDLENLEAGLPDDARFYHS